MYECENCINECICNLCVCCNMNPCICSMKSTDFITNEQLHKNCINKEKLLQILDYHLSEHLKSCEAEITPYWYAMINLIEIINNE